MLKESTLRRARIVTEQKELYKGKDFGIRDIMKKAPYGETFYDKFVAPEVGGYQMPGVGRAVTPVAAAIMYQQALDRGAGPGAVMGTVGGAAGGAGFGGLAGLQAAKAFETNRAEVEANGAEEGDTSRKPAKTNKGARIKGLAGVGAQLATRLGAMAIGSGLGSAVGSVAGGAEGFLGGRSSGAGVLGGGVAAGTAAGLAAGIGSMIPATGKGSFAWPSLAIATASGFLGSEIMSNLVKNVEAARKRVAVGGADSRVFPQGPLANRVG